MRGRVGVLLTAHANALAPTLVTTGTYYYIFTVGPEIFMMKTACWMMGWPV